MVLSSPRFSLFGWLNNLSCWLPIGLFGIVVGVVVDVLEVFGYPISLSGVILNKANSIQLKLNFSLSLAKIHYTLSV